MRFRSYAAVLAAVLLANACVSSRQVPDDSRLPVGDTSMTSVDWAGRYSGIVPCADCAGIETTIVLASDRTFVRTMRYLGRDDRVFEQRGAFVWMPDGGRIQLQGVGDGATRYLVGENQIIQLDLQGNRITGAMADRYVLRKIPDTTAAVPSGLADYVASRAAAVSADTPLM